MAAPADGADLEASLLSFEKLDRASPDLWPEQLPGVAEFAASFKSPITSSPPKWMAELENDDIDMLKELGSLTTANLMEKVRGLQNLAYQLGLDESMYPILLALVIPSTFSSYSDKKCIIEYSSGFEIKIAGMGNHTSDFPDSLLEVEGDCSEILAVMPGKPLMLHPQLQLLRTEPSIVIFGLGRTKVDVIKYNKSINIHGSIPETVISVPVRYEEEGTVGMC
ncbi:protein lin-52 [Grus japonensis]